MKITERLPGGAMKQSPGPELSRQLGTRHARRRHRLSGAIARTARGREINDLVVRVGIIGPNGPDGIQRGPWGSARPLRVLDDGGSGLTLDELSGSPAGRRRRDRRSPASPPRRSA